MSRVPSQMFMLSLQGPTGDGRTLIESWMLPKEMYMHMRQCMEGEPVATSVTDGRGRLLSTSYGEDETQCI